MVILTTLLILQGAGLIGSMPSGPGVPENITVTFLNPTSVKVSWMTSINNVDKYDVTYKPTDARILADDWLSYRVVAVVAGNSEAVTLNGLKADTQYQVTVAAVFNGKKYRSRPIVFRTLEPSRVAGSQQDAAATGLLSGGPSASPSDSGAVIPPAPSNSLTEPEEFVHVRGVEIGIVLLVLIVWVAAIALFFNRWGKIRMLLPYQPDYKEQLKVPGTGACAAAAAAQTSCTGNHAASHVCPQNCRWASTQLEASCAAAATATAAATAAAAAARRYRPRVNSAIFISNSGPGFEAMEFLRRHGSQSKLCRKAQSEENIPLTKTHFGLPVLSVSGPSPPDEEPDRQDSADECL